MTTRASLTGSSSWTINGQTFASLELSSLTRTRVSQAPDVVTFKAPGFDYDGDELFAYDSTIVIMKDGVRWFTGKVKTIPRHGGPDNEQISWTVLGPWHDLERTIYQQQWTISDADGVISQAWKSRVILGQNSAYTHITTGAVIADAISYCSSLGGNLAAGTIDPALLAPWEEGTDIWCSEVIIKMLRWSPDVVTWFDYTAETPILHIRKRSNLTAVAYSGAGGSPVRDVDITPRYDLKVPVVVVNYEITHQVDGQSLMGLFVDQYPVGSTARQIGALSFTMGLAGMTSQHTSQELGTEDLPHTGLGDSRVILLNNTTWWKAHVDCLKEAADNVPPTVAGITNLSISGGARQYPDLDLPREVVIGAPPEWHHKKTRLEKFTAFATYAVYDETGATVKLVKNEPITCTIQTTDAEGHITEPPDPPVAGKENRRRGQIFRRNTVEDFGEIAAVGIAEALYNSLSVLQFEGSIVLEQSECDGLCHPGKGLNLTDALTAWATMNAMIQQTTEDVDQGITTVQFGPPAQLGPADLAQVGRANRLRKIPGAYSDRSSEQDYGDKNDDTAKEKPTRGSGELQKLILKLGAGNIHLDPAEITGAYYYLGTTNATEAHFDRVRLHA